MEPPTGLQTAGYSPAITKYPSLPAELWRMIFLVVEPGEHSGFWSTYDYPTMASICRCCTLFRDLVRPILYCNFDVRVRPCESNGWFRLSVAKFARTIGTNPNLASLVRRVHINRVCEMCDIFDENPATLTRNPDHPMALALTERAAELGIDFKYYEDYTYNRSGNSGFDLVELVLAQLPLLDTLSIHWHDTETISGMSQPRDGWPWAQSIRKMSLRYLDLTGAGRVHSRGQPNFPDSSLSRILPLLSTGGNLTELSLVDSTGPSLPLPLDNLRQAGLVSCQFRPGQLQNLLRNCKSLRKFVYSGAIHSLQPPSRDFIEALEPAYNSLEVLDIDLRLCDDVSPRRIPSLKQFTGLKTLTIDMNCVWDWEAAANQGSPSTPDMLFASLLPELIEEVTLLLDDFGAASFGSQLGDQFKRLALERTEKGGLQLLKQVRGQGFPSLYDDDLDDDPDGTPRAESDAVRRAPELGEAINLLRDGGVEVILDGQGFDGESSDEQGDSELEYESDTSGSDY